MKNLKRALSLVLSTAMLLGMMVVGTGASYSDVPADNEYVEAIEVMQAIGVMSGVSETEFNPEGLVTRHEAAVIMANMLELDVADFETAISPFNDVADWAVPYVAACYSDGIMAGVGNGNFGGEMKITAAQMALMLMKALGYFQFEADFGDDWQLATVREASKIELFEDVKTSATANLTRGQVAQMCLNALEADTVDWDGDLGTSVTLPDGTSVVSGYSIKYVSDKYMGSEDVYNGEADGIIQLAEKLFDEDLEKEEVSGDDFGRPATKWSWENDEIDTFQDVADKTWNDRVTKAAMYDYLGKDKYEDLCDGTRELTVYVDGNGDKVEAANIENYVHKNDTGKINQRASSVEVYIDDDGEDKGDVTIIVINTYVIQAADDYSAKNESLKIDTLHNASAEVEGDDLEVDDFPMIENVSEDDYLLVTAAQGEIKTVKLAEVITGRVNTYTEADTVTIDGTKYNYAAKACTDDDNGKAVTYSVGEDATVVLADGHIIYVDDAAVSADKYVFIAEIKNDSDFGTDDAEYIAKAYFLDGTKKTIDIKDEFKNPEADVAETTTGKWYTYSVNDNDVYTLYQIADQTTVTADEGETLIANKGTKIGTYTVNSKTQLVILDEDGDPAAYVGVKNVPTIDIPVVENAVLTGTAFVAYDDGVAEYIFIDAEDFDIDESSTSEDFIFVLKYDHTGIDADDDTYYGYKAIVNGEAGMIYTDYTLPRITLNGDNKVVGKLYADIEADADGYITGMDEISVGEEDYVKAAQAFDGAVIDYDDDVLTIAGESFVLADDCQIILIAADHENNIKSDANETAEVYSNISAKSLANECDDYSCTGFYWAQENDDDELTALYIVVTCTGAHAE